MKQSHSLRFWAGLVCVCPLVLRGQVHDLARVVVQEPAGLVREHEFVEIALQVDSRLVPDIETAVVAVDQGTGQRFPCQTFNHQLLAADQRMLFAAAFPVTLQAHERREFLLQAVPAVEITPAFASDLAVQGDALELVVENRFYRADLTASPQSEGKSHHAGQLRELRVKMDFNVLLTRRENRIHWAPNFRRYGEEDYKNIAQWDTPRVAILEQGPYLVRTRRQDLAPGLPELLLHATYTFYAGKPYFIFFSSMHAVQPVWLDLLRNDEMTMDSLFTHLAFQRQEGDIVELPLAERDAVLSRRPIADDAPWLCFYHQGRGYGFASIRLAYNNKNDFGEPSPTYRAHTKISDGAGGGKYWNRRLIHDHVTYVPAGSRYTEENAYLVFKISSGNRFAGLRYWADRLRQRISVTVVEH